MASTGERLRDVRAVRLRHREVAAGRPAMPLPRTRHSVAARGRAGELPDVTKEIWS